MRWGSGVEQQGPDPLGKGRAAGLAREQRIDTARLQPVREQARLRGLAGTLAALKGDELARCHGKQPPLTCGRASSTVSVAEERITAAIGWPGTRWNRNRAASGRPDPRPPPRTEGLRSSCLTRSSPSAPPPARPFLVAASAAIDTQYWPAVFGLPCFAAARH